MHQRLLRLIHVLEDGLLILTLGAMILLALLQIALRNFFDTGFEWSDALLRVLVLWLGLLGAIAATRQNRHISIDLISRLLPRAGRVITGLLSNLFSAAVCALISYHATRFVIMEYEDGITAFADVPAWVLESIIPLGFGLMALRFLANLGAVFKGVPAAGPGVQG